MYALSGASSSTSRIRINFSLNTTERLAQCSIVFVLAFGFALVLVFVTRSTAAYILAVHTHPPFRGNHLDPIDRAPVLRHPFGTQHLTAGIALDLAHRAPPLPDAIRLHPGLVFCIPR